MLGYLPHLLLALTALTAAALALYTWRRRPGVGIVPLAVLLLTVADWSGFYLFEMIANDMPTMLFFGRLEYFGITGVPAAWLVFALAYTGQKRWLTRRLYLALLIEPAIVILANWTNSLHHLFRVNMWIQQYPTFSIMRYEQGVLFWLHTAYAYVLVSIGTWLFLRMLLRSRQLHRGQTVSVLVGMAVPWIGNAAYLFLDAPFDFTPAGFLISGAAMVWALFRYRFLDITPVARDAVFEKMADSVLILDPTRRLIDLNPAAQRMLARPLREILGTPLDELLPNVDANFKRSLTDNVELLLNTPSGDLTMTLRTTPLRGREEKLDGWLIVLNDITAYKQTELALQHSESSYRSLFEASFEALVIYEGNRVLDVNRAFEDLFDYTRAEVVGRSPLDFVAPAERERVQSHISSGVPRPLESQGLRKSGDVFEGEVRIKTISYQGLPAWVASIRDVTERNNAEMVLQQQLKDTLVINRVISAITSSHDMKTILEIITRELGEALRLPQMSIGLLDDTGENLTVVAEYLRPGRPSAKGVVISISGNPATKYVVESGEPLIISDMRTDPRLDEAMHEEARRRDIITLVLLPLRISGRVVGTLGLDSTEPRDFTPAEVMLAENVAAAASQVLERARLYENLHDELVERRRAQHELREANTQLEEANRLKMHFMANMSHELRTPLNSILGYTDMMQQGLYGPITEKQSDRLEKVNRNGKLLLQLINDILDVSRIEAGKIDITLEPVSLQDMVAASIVTVETQIASKKLDLHVMMSDLPSVQADTGRLQQVLTNLFSNAVKFTHSGSITVQARRCDPAADDLPPGLDIKGRDWVLFSVKDTGIGIAPKDQAVIFDEFRQADSSSTREYEGTGLGLAISRRLVLMMGGHIWVESAVGLGSTFFVLLPVAKDAPSPDQTAAPTLKAD